MIFPKTRYVDGRIVVQPDRSVWVARVFPRTDTRPDTGKGRFYTWKESDRIDRVAARTLGDPNLWWRIMDANPTVMGPHDIRPGQEIRIPRR